MNKYYVWFLGRSATKTIVTAKTGKEAKCIFLKQNNLDALNAFRFVSCSKL